MLLKWRFIGIEGEKDLICAKDLISLADLSLRVKYDSAKKISWAIKTGQLSPLYFHKMGKADGQNDEEKMECYYFKINLNFRFLYFSNFHRIFFLKRQVLDIESTENYFSVVDEVVTPPIERIATSNNIIVILKNTIKDSGIRVIPTLTSDLDAIPHLLARLFMHLYSLIITNGFRSFLTNSYKYDAAYISGYTPNIPQIESLEVCDCAHIVENSQNITNDEELTLEGFQIEHFDAQKYINEHPFRTTEERGELAHYLASKGLTVLEIGRLLSDDKGINVEDSTLKQRVYRWKRASL